MPRIEAKTSAMSALWDSQRSARPVTTSQTATASVNQATTTILAFLYTTVTYVPRAGIMLFLARMSAYRALLAAMPYSGRLYAQPARQGNTPQQQESQLALSARQISTPVAVAAPRAHGVLGSLARTVQRVHQRAQTRAYTACAVLAPTRKALAKCANSAPRANLPLSATANAALVRPVATQMSGVPPRALPAAQAPLLAKLGLRRARAALIAPKEDTTRSQVCPSASCVSPAHFAMSPIW